MSDLSLNLPPLSATVPDFLQEAFERWNILASDGKRTRKSLEAAWPEIEALYRELVEVNTHTNLTRLTGADEFCLRHILDSALLLPYLNDGDRVADVGSGAGFPAFPMALFCPEIQVMAIESVGKKARFIDETAEKLGMKGRLRAVPQRAEVLCDAKLAQAAKEKGLTSFREAFDVVSARAVSALPLLLEMCLPLVKVGGHFIALKGPKVADELKNATRVLTLLGGQVKLLESFENHEMLNGTVLLVIEKVAHTPFQYPRPTAQIKKGPLS